jgi:hypothetical protein
MAVLVAHDSGPPSGDWLRALATSADPSRLFRHDDGVVEPFAGKHSHIARDARWLAASSETTQRS